MISIKEKSIVLLHGVSNYRLFDLLKKNKAQNIFVLEGRPNLEAAKISSKELLKRKIKPTLIADNMAGFLFYKNLVKEAWLSYYCVDQKGALCAIGALIVAVLAKQHKIKVNLFPTEGKTKFLGNPEDIFQFLGKRVAPKNIRGYVPLVEWVDQKYVGKIYE